MNFKVSKRYLHFGILMAITSAFTLMGYEAIRSPSTTLFKFAYGPQSLPYVMGAMPVFVLVTLFIYSKVLEKLGPQKTLLVTTLGSGFTIALCYSLIQIGYKPATIILYFVRETYIVLLIEQYWSFINSTVDQDTGKKLSGPIIAISSLGAIGGGLIVSFIAERVGTENVLLVAALSTVPAALFSNLAYIKFGEPEVKKKSPDHREALKFGGFKDLMTHKLLMGLFIIVLITQILSTVTSLNFQYQMQEAYPEADKQTAFSGRFFTILNATAFIGQFFVAPLLTRVMPVRYIHIMLPLINLMAALVVLSSSGFMPVAGAYLLFKSMDYSIFRVAKEVLYIPFDFDVRYRTKLVIDVFGYRFGKGGPSNIISILQQFVAVGSGFFVAVGIGACLLWMAVAFWIKKEPHMRSV